MNKPKTCLNCYYNTKAVCTNLGSLVYNQEVDDNYTCDEFEVKLI